MNPQACVSFSLADTTPAPLLLAFPAGGLSSRAYGQFTKAAFFCFSQRRAVAQLRIASPRRGADDAVGAVGEERDGETDDLRKREDRARARLREAAPQTFTVLFRKQLAQ